MSERDSVLLMRAVHGQGWQTLEQIVQRIGRGQPAASIAPLAWHLGQIGWLRFDGRDRWISARLAAHT